MYLLGISNPTDVRRVTVSGKNQHVVRRDEGWAVRGEGNTRDTSRHGTQAEAIDAARETAQNQQSEVVIHRPDGRIRDRDSYGSDPFPPRDRKH
jgi:hypothetical protein